MYSNKNRKSVDEMVVMMVDSVEGSVVVELVEVEEQMGVVEEEVEGNLAIHNLDSHFQKHKVNK